MSNTENIFSGAKKHIIGRRLTLEQLAAHFTMSVINDNVSIEVERGDMSKDMGLKDLPLEERNKLVGYGIDGSEHAGQFIVILLKAEETFTSNGPVTEEEFRVMTLQLQNMITTAKSQNVSVRIN